METVSTLAKQGDETNLTSILDKPLSKTDALLSDMLLARVPLKKQQKQSKNRPSRNRLRIIKNSKKLNRKKK